MDGFETLRSLCAEQIAALEFQRDEESIHYLRGHCSNRNVFERQAAVLNRYLPFVKGRVLDWGCMHAPDASLLRIAGYEELEIAGCDVFPADHFRVFHDYARLRYTQIDHPWRLPYDDASFDTIIGDGVLEHVPNDHESLTELYRVLRPGGCLILCCLPNRWSYTEALARVLGRPHHLRTYGLREMRRTLLHHGFRPLRTSSYQMVPALTSDGAGPVVQRFVRGLWNMNGLLERIWPLNRLASNLMVIAEKCHAIHWTRDYPIIARGAPVRAALV